MKALTLGSVCSGIGGMDLGFERAGMVCKWQVEIDDWCRRVLAKHWPNVRRYRDVKQVGAELGAVDVTVGGIPCQPHSVAGQRRGASDDRNLWPDYFRIIGTLKPRWVVVENVPGIRTTMLDQVLSDLESAGYTVTTFNIPAIAFSAPHIRERIWVVANTRGGGFRQLLQQKQESRRETSTDARCDGKIQSVAHSNRERKPQPQGTIKDKRRRIGDTSWWEVEPPVGRVADGIPRRVDRIRGLGGTVVPQMAEWVGQIIVELDRILYSSEVADRDNSKIGKSVMVGTQDDTVIN